MKSVKWLYSLFFALTFTLAVEIAGTFAVADGLTWYKGLTLPALTTGPAVHKGLWCAVYAAEAYVIAQLLVSNKMKPYAALYLGVKLLSAIWTVLFFEAHVLLLSLMVLTLTLIMNFAYFKNLLKTPTHRIKTIVFIPVLIWYCYLWIINYCIVLLN